jgi:hypothetical protein
MENASQTYGFNYRFSGKTFALAVQAAGTEQARARVLAMASAAFVSELSPVLRLDLTLLVRPSIGEALAFYASRRDVGEPSRGAERSSPRQFFPDCTIAMCGYDFREGQEGPNV